MATQKNWRRLFKQARRALKQGRRGEARRLAREVVSLAPKQEAPWLLLAAAAEPRASIGYLKEALALNPNSKRAQQGLRWAKKRLNQVPPARDSRNQGPKAGSLALPQINSYALMAAGALTIFLILFAWLRPPGLDLSLKVVSAAAANQADALFTTQTSSPTPTLPASLTASPTNTPTPAATFTSTPVTATNSPVPTNGPEAKEAQAKFKAEVPSYVGEDEHWIDINLSTQMVTAFKGNQVVRSFTVSTGRGATTTVVGEFRIWVKVRIQDMSGPGYYLKDVPYVMFFYKDYGLHGTYWHNNFGTPMSAGCVNMTIDDSEWMFQFASVGTLVKVHY